MSATVKPCGECGGSGRIPNWLEDGRTMRCPQCGGHKVEPDGDGPYWFYQRTSWKHRGAYWSQRVACVVRDEDGWRITNYYPRGPVGHYYETQRPFWEVANYVRHPLAERMVDVWAKRPFWNHL